VFQRSLSLKIIIKKKCQIDILYFFTLRRCGLVVLEQPICHSTIHPTLTHILQWKPWFVLQELSLELSPTQLQTPQCFLDIDFDGS
jgi:hypothetical protein